MTATFSSGNSFNLQSKLNPTDSSLLGNADVGVTKGRLFLKNDSQKEWISFATVTAVGDGTFTYGGLVRGLSQTADPSTAGTGLTWLANQECILVAMHDQLIDKQEGVAFTSTTIAGIRANNLTTTQRLALTPANGNIVYDTTLGELYQYIGGAWSAVSAGSTQPNASATVAGKVEIATSSQSKAGTDTGETGALLSVLPSDIAKNIQSGSFLTMADATDSGTDAYITTATPTLTAYTKGSLYNVSFTEVNTTTAPTLNIDGLGAVEIRDQDNIALAVGDIPLNSSVILMKGQTYFKMIRTLPATTTRKGSVEMATSAEALTGTDSDRAMAPSTTKDSIKDSIGIITTGLSFTTNIQAATSGIVAGYVRRNASTCRAECYVGAANPADVLVQISGSASQDIYGAFCFPVKKGYYWRVDAINSPDASALTFTPNA